MNFQELHELLRLELLKRIERGTLTGTRLARQTGFQQAHISNFLNRKRALSLEGLDRVLTSQSLTIDQLLPLDLAATETAPVADSSVEAVPVVSASTAMHEARIHPSAIIETVQISASRLHDSRSRLSSRQSKWQRFLAIHVDAQQAAAMAPILTPGAVAVIDRHYNSLAPYRAQQPTLYAVRFGSALLLRYIELDGSHLLLRPSNVAFPVQLLTLSPEGVAADYIVGRVCTLLSDL